MTVEQWISLIVSIVTGLATCIPLVINLVKFVKKAAKEKNWKSVVNLVLKLMAEAEQNYKEGADKKTYVLDTLVAMSSTLEYDIDIDAVSTLIDNLVVMSKQVNTNKK